MRASGEMLICKDVGAYRKGLGIEGVCLSTPREKLRSGAGQNELAVDQVLANFVAELFVILHPATLPMLERMSTPEGNCIGGPEQNCITTGLALR